MIQTSILPGNAMTFTFAAEQPRQFPTQLTSIGASVSSLFDMHEADQVFRDKGEKEYKDYIEHRITNGKPLAPGALLVPVRKLLAYNEPDRILVNLTIVSRSHPYTQKLVAQSLNAHGLTLRHKKRNIVQGWGATYTQGAPITPDILRSHGVKLFLSTNEEDVKTALSDGIAAGVVSKAAKSFGSLGEIRADRSKNVILAFDFDRVTAIARGKPGDKFHGDSEDYFTQQARKHGYAKGLLNYSARESTLADHPAEPGPLSQFYIDACRLRATLQDNLGRSSVSIAVVTARYGSALERVATTLREWEKSLREPGLIDPAVSLEPDRLISSGNIEKTGHLKATKPDLFFDDSQRHITGAQEVIGAPIWVPWVAGKPKLLAASVK